MIRMLAAVIAILSTPAVAEYKLAIEQTGKREYYCTMVISLTNDGDEHLTEINAFFLNFVGDREVGRSKGSSFFNVAPGGSASAEFETPNAPCQEVDRYHMVIGACRLGPAFEDKSVCAARVRLDAPFVSVSTLE